MKRSQHYLFLAAFIASLCVLIVIFFSRVPFIRGFTGDVLIVILLFLFLKIFYDFPSGTLAFCVLAFSFAVEGLQYLQLIKTLGLSNNRVAQIILGSVFDPLDLLAYTIGACASYLLDVKLRR